MEDCGEEYESSLLKNTWKEYKICKIKDDLKSLLSHREETQWQTKDFQVKAKSAQVNVCYLLSSAYHSVDIFNSVMTGFDVDSLGANSVNSNEYFFTSLRGFKY